MPLLVIPYDHEAMRAEWAAGVGSDRAAPALLGTDICLSVTSRLPAVHGQPFLDEQLAAPGLEPVHWDLNGMLYQCLAMASALIGARDAALAGHSQRVAKYALALGQVLGLTAAQSAFVHAAGLLHDVGKVGIPDAILHKPGRLTAEEYAVVKQHPLIGERILSAVKPLCGLARMVSEHHERYDGQGYPHGMGGATISLRGRILAVTDALDAMLSDRLYSTRQGLPDVLAELGRCAGTQFAPAVAAAVHHLVARHGPAFFENPGHHLAVRHPAAGSEEAVA